MSIRESFRNAIRRFIFPEKEKVIDAGAHKNIPSTLAIVNDMNKAHYSELDWATTAIGQLFEIRRELAFDQNIPSTVRTGIEHILEVLKHERAVAIVETNGNLRYVDSGWCESKVPSGEMTIRIVVRPMNWKAPISSATNARLRIPLVEE